MAAAGLSVGILSAGEGRYSISQLLLDIGQGARVSASAYPRSEPPILSLRVAGTTGTVGGWRRARSRAAAAPGRLTPGLLATQIPGGAGYVAVSGVSHLDGIVAADEAGRVAAVSLGPPGTLLARTLGLLASHRLVVADLPGGRAGVSALGRLVAARPPGSLLIAVQREEDGRRGQLLWAGLAGPGPGGRELSSPSTQQRGLIVSTDLGPTVLEWLGLRVPGEVGGRAIEAGGRLDPGALTSLMARLRVIGGRRLRALAGLLCAWLALLLACSGSPRARAWAMRTGALGVLWTPVVVMITAAFEPGAAAEYAAIAVLALAAGALSDRLAPWPRALIAPALAAPVAITADALSHSQLLMRSLLGPDPALGSRFYGIGNELKSGLAVLVIAGVAAALHPGSRGRPAQRAMVAAGLTLAVIEGSSRIGAGVGGVILVSVAFALAAVLLGPVALSGRRALLVVLAPIAGLMALAAIDLTFAGGRGHFSGSILHASSAADVRAEILRRYGAAFSELGNHAMPVAAALALALGIAGGRRSGRLLAPVGGDPVWQAALAGGLAGGLAGALVEDSGPVLLIVAVFALGCVLSYLWGRPADARRHTPGRIPATRSRARRPPAEPVRSGS